MAPYELKGLTVKQLGEIRNAMADLKYILEVEKLPLEKRKESAWILSQVQSAFLKIRQIELSSIRDQLIANETDLTAGIGQIQKVLADLKLGTPDTPAGRPACPSRSTGTGSPARSGCHVPRPARPP